MPDGATPAAIQVRPAEGRLRRTIFTSQTAAIETRPRTTAIVAKPAITLDAGPAVAYALNGLSHSEFEATFRPDSYFANATK